MARTVVVGIVGLEVLKSKSNSVYTILGPCSKHCKTFVAIVLTPGAITLDIVPEIQSNIPKKDLSFKLLNH